MAALTLAQANRIIEAILARGAELACRPLSVVVVVESPASEARMRDMFKALDAVLRTHPEVGAYNQTI